MVILISFLVGDKEEEYVVTNIQKAIDRAKSGETIKVPVGTYYENIIIDKPIKLVGEHTRLTVINGNNSGSVITIYADGVTIKGFTIINSGNHPNACGIFVNSSDNIIQDNEIKDNDYGIGLWGATNNKIIDNQVSNSKWSGIYLASLSHSNTIKENTIVGNMSDDNDDDYCINLNGASNNVIQENSVSYCYNGISLINSDENTISENNVENNTNGLGITESDDNQIFKNNFLNNLHNAYDNSNNAWYEDSLEEGNYWDDYAGNDNDDDGIGDTSYKIDDGTNEDEYPLMNKVES
jgi:parallel beta-helix repeat protein